jgi:hypothetical protein
MDIRFNVAGDRCQFFVPSNLLLGSLPLAEDTLRRFLVVPEIGFGDARFERFQALTVLRCVKDNSVRE